MNRDQSNPGQDPQRSGQQSQDDMNRGQQSQQDMNRGQQGSAGQSRSGTRGSPDEGSSGQGKR